MAGKNPQTLVVLGMHRSGTSALTNLLVRGGAWFGDPAVSTGANRENPRGFFERRDMRALTDPALAELGCRWHDVYGFSPAWPAAFARSTRSSFNRTIGRDFRGHALSVIKEPRLCLLLPLFRPVLPAPAAVLVLRNPVEVAMSLRRRNGFPLSLGLALWEFYNRHALAAVQDIPWTTVRYEQLASHAERETAALFARLRKLGVRGLSVKAAAASNPIEAPLRRERARSGDPKQLLSGEQFAFWRKLSGSRPDTASAAVSELSTATEDTLRLHKAVCAAAKFAPYLRLP